MESPTDFAEFSMSGLAELVIELTGSRATR
jgi:hypothetical protein